MNYDEFLIFIEEKREDIDLEITGIYNAMLPHARKPRDLDSAKLSLSDAKRALYEIESELNLFE